VSANAGVGLARIVVAAPKRRLDIALPEHLPLAALLPRVLFHAGEELADEGLDHSGWVLRRSNGVVLETGRSLAAQGLRDGEVLHLVPRQAEWPEPEYDDVVDAISAGARRRGVLWGPAATRWTGLVIAMLLLLLALTSAVLAGPPWLVPGLVALGLAVVCLVGGTVMARAMTDATAGAVLASVGPLAAFVGGLLVFAGPERLSRLGAPHLLSGCALLLVASLFGYVGTGVQPRVFIAGAVAGLVGLLIAALAYTWLNAVQSAAVAVSLLLLLAPALPLLAVRMGKVPMPALPRSVEDLVRDDPMPPAIETYAAVARADDVFTGLMIGTILVSLPSLAILARAGGIAAPLLAGIASTAYLLRARLFPAVRHRVPLLVTGFGGLALLALGLAERSGGTGRVLIGLLLLAAAVIAVVAGLRYAYRVPSVYLGRIGDILDVVLVLAVVPIAAGVLGLYSFMRGLSG
jgi:type VII secretion integral membrane protein EccD